MNESTTNEPNEPSSTSESRIASGLERVWATVLHLSALLGMVVPLANILAPLAIWLIKKVELPALDRVGKEVLNFQISWTIYLVVASFLALVGSCLILPLIFPLLVGIPMLILTIVGAVKTSNGESYRHPWTLKFFG